jgi:UDP-N-acetylglucosamine acyltransferase
VGLQSTIETPESGVVIARNSEQESKPHMPKVSPQATVEKGAQLAADVVVGPFSYVGPQARIGAGCVIESNVTIIGPVVLGRKNHVFPMCVIGAGDDSGERGSITLGDGNSIREHVTICGGAGAATTIGRDTLIMIESHVGAGAVVGDHCIFANCTHVGPGAKIEDYVGSSAFASVEPGIRVGAYTFIAGFTGIDRDAPPYAIVWGYPYRVRGVNTQKLKRCGFDDEDIQALKQAFHQIFNGGDDGAVEKAIQQLPRTLAANPRVQTLLEALRNPKRGKRR